MRNRERAVGQSLPLAPGEAPGRGLALYVLPSVLAVAPLVVLPGHVDFARLPQEAFVLVSALAVTLLWVTRGASGGVRTTRLDSPLLAFLAWSAASLLASAQPAAGLRTLGHWGACALAFLVVSRSARGEDVLRLASGLLLGGALAAAVGLGQALFGLAIVPQAAPPAATLANRGVAAGYLAALAPLALSAWPTRRARIAAAIGAVTILAFLPFTRSRAAAVAVGLQVLLLLAQRGRSGRLRCVAPLGVALLTLGTVAWVSRSDSAKVRSAGIRLALARSALSMAQERPLAGVGIGGFAAQYPRHGPLLRSAGGAPLRVDSPHNEGLQVLAESGLPGLLAGTWVAAVALGAFRRVRAAPDPSTRRTALALGLSLVGLAVDAAFGFPLRTGVPPLVLAVLLGMLVASEPQGPPVPRRIASPGRRLRLAAALCLALALAAATSWSLRRLQDDRALYEGVLVPVHAQAGPPPLAGGGEARAPACRAGVSLDVRSDGRIDLVASGVPLPDVLDCLVERLALRLDYDGQPPRTTVSVALRGKTLAGVVTSIFEGLGVDYLLSLDPSETNVDQLIVLGSSRGAEASHGPAGAPTAGRPAAEHQAIEAAPADQGPVAPEAPERPESEEPFPEPDFPEELTPMTFQPGRRSPAGAARVGMSPAPWAFVAGGGV